MDPVLTESLNPATTNRWDLFAFLAAFIAGEAAYFGFRFTLGAFGLETSLIQLFVTISIVTVMILYAVVVSRVGRLRVRLDQAGDNAYYLGLLFTLTSMAFALWEFGQAVLEGSAIPLQMAGPRQIISNFGIALATTITGIFLRVILHQMRVDPADLESMTRIELAEASTRVRSILETVTLDMARFHEEVRQRTADVVDSLLADTSASGKRLTDAVQRATEDMLLSTQSGQEVAIGRNSEVTRLLGDVANETIAAVQRLKSVEPPPLLLSRRLDGLARVLEQTSNHIEKLTANMESAAASAQQATGELAQAGSALVAFSESITKSQTGAAQSVVSAVNEVSTALEAVGKRLEQDRTLLADLESQSVRSAQEAERAQSASIEVLVRLTEVTKGLTGALRLVERGESNAKRS